MKSDLFMRHTVAAIVYTVYCVWMILERDPDVLRFIAVIAVFTLAMERLILAFDAATEERAKKHAQDQH